MPLEGTHFVARATFGCAMLIWHLRFQEPTAFWFRRGPASRWFRGKNRIDFRRKKTGSKHSPAELSALARLFSQNLLLRCICFPWQHRIFKKDSIETCTYPKESPSKRESFSYRPYSQAQRFLKYQRPDHRPYPTLDSKTDQQNKGRLFNGTLFPRKFRFLEGSSPELQQS